MSFLASPSKDLIILVVIVLLFAGPKQLPKLARSLGESKRELNKGLRETHTDETAETADVA